MPSRDSNPFAEAVIEHQALEAEQPIDNQALFASLGRLEATGLGMVGADGLDMAAFNEVMHTAFSKVADLEIVPPLSEAQKAIVAGKVSLFGAAREASEAKSNKPRDQKTDTDKIDTDSRKK